MKFTLRVDYVDGSTVEVTAVTADIIDFEANFERSFLAALDETRATDLYGLAWTALKRQGQTELDWREWLEQVDNAKMLTGEAAPRPLGRKSRSRSASSDSRSTSASPSPS